MYFLLIVDYNVYSLLSSYYPGGILMEEFQMQFVA
jgi:hypothetical protein